VRECSKGDDQSQWRRANFDPPPRDARYIGIRKISRYYMWRYYVPWACCIPRYTVRRYWFSIRFHNGAIYFILYILFYDMRFCHIRCHNPPRHSEKWGLCVFYYYQFQHNM